MAAQVVAAGELTEHLTDITEAHGDTPIVIGSESDAAVESVGRPATVSITPAGDADSFQAYDHAHRQDASRIKAALIN